MTRLTGKVTAFSFVLWSPGMKCDSWNQGGPHGSQWGPRVADSKMAGLHAAGETGLLCLASAARLWPWKTSICLGLTGCWVRFATRSQQTAQRFRPWGQGSLQRTLRLQPSRNVAGSLSGQEAPRPTQESGVDPGRVHLPQPPSAANGPGPHTQTLGARVPRPGAGDWAQAGFRGRWGRSAQSGRGRRRFSPCAEGTKES